MQASEPSSRRPRLRAAHVTQIPLRTADLCQRGKRLCESGWDINAALLLAQDAEALAATCRQLEERSTAGRLEHFAENLWSLLEPPIVPEAHRLEELAARFAAFEAGSADGIDAALAHDELPSGLFGYAATEENGFPLLTRPPSRYWSRFATLAPPDRIGPAFVAAAPASAAIESDSPAIEPPVPELETASIAHVEDDVVETQVESPAAGDETHAIDIPAPSGDFVSDSPVEPTIDAAARVACHLHAGSDLAAAIDLQLGMLGFSLVHLDDVDALKEWLGRSKPALIMLDGEYQQ